MILCRKSISENGVCVYDRGGNGTCLCVLQSVCRKRNHVDGSDGRKQRFGGNTGAGRRVYVRKNASNLGGDCD